MIQGLFPVVHVREVARNIHVLRFVSPEISSQVRPGQFLNIRVADGFEPLLRRPFSVYRTEGEAVEIIFNVVGRGTLLLSRKHSGEHLDILGPLGVPFRVDGQEFQTGILVGGGLGVAPLPITTAALRAGGKRIHTYLGGRSKDQVVDAHLENLKVSTDDGTRGFRGTVVDLLAKEVREVRFASPKIFACGPTPMLRAVADFAIHQDIPCEISMEGAMACGIGICQGCPVELVGAERKYALMCKDGPTFDVRKVKF